MRIHPSTCFSSLTLVRHAESHFNVAIRKILPGEVTTASPNWESPLTKHGENQAMLVGEWLGICREGTCYHPLITSTLVRSRMTAGIIGRALKAAHPDHFDDWEVVPELNERSFGLCHEVADQASLLYYLESQQSRLNQPLSWQPLGGESLDQVRVRASGFLNKLGQNQGGEPFVVASSWPIWAIRAQIEDWEPEELAAHLADPNQYLGYCDVVQYRAEGFGVINDAGGYKWKRVIHYSNLPVSSSEGWERMEPSRSRTSEDLLSATKRYRHN